MSDTSTTEDFTEKPGAGIETEARSRWANLAQRLFFVLAVKPFMTLFIGLRVNGRERLPNEGPFIVFANHSSHLDTISLLNLFPVGMLPNLRPVAAADYFDRNRWISLLTRTLFNTLTIARREITPGNHPIRRMQRALAVGQSLIVFPEGTRGSGEAIGSFRSGLAHLVEEAPEIPVVPVCLINMGRSLPKGTFIPVPFFCEIRIGEPRRLTGTRADIRQTLETALRDLINGVRSNG